MYLCGNGCYNKIHKLSHICLADVDPEENVQIMDQELINETCLRASYSETCFFSAFLQVKVTLQTRSKTEYNKKCHG